LQDVLAFKQLLEKKDPIAVEVHAKFSSSGDQSAYATGVLKAVQKSNNPSKSPVPAGGAPRGGNNPVKGGNKSEGAGKQGKVSGPNPNQQAKKVTKIPLHQTARTPSAAAPAAAISATAPASATPAAAAASTSTSTSGYPLTANDASGVDAAGKHTLACCFDIFALHFD
jgi:hypothetical protein